MFLSSVGSCLDYNILINNSLVRNLTPLQKKIAVVALTIFCAFSLGYCLFSSFFAKKETIQNSEDAKSQQQFDKHINLNQEKSPNLERSPVKKKENRALRKLAPRQL